MFIPARILRADADDRPGGSPTLSPRELDRKDRIIAFARRWMARHGRTALTMSNFAAGLNLGVPAIRRLFPDMDSILFEVLLRHLTSIDAAITTVPRDAPDRQAAQRAAYLNATRTGVGGPSEAHTLLVREAHTLPPDLAEQVDDIRCRIGRALAGPFADPALAILDIPFLDHHQIEALLHTLRTTGRAPAATPDLPANRPSPASGVPRMAALKPVAPAESAGWAWTPPPSAKDDNLAGISARAGPS